MFKEQIEQPSKKNNFVRKCDTQMKAYLGSVDLGLFDS